MPVCFSKERKGVDLWMAEGTGRNRGSENHNQYLLYEKKNIFNKRQKSKERKLRLNKKINCC